MKFRVFCAVGLIFVLSCETFPETQIKKQSPHLKLENVSAHELCPGSNLQIQRDDCCPTAPTENWVPADGVIGATLPEAIERDELGKTIADKYLLATYRKDRDELRALEGLRASEVLSLDMNEFQNVRIDEMRFTEKIHEITSKFQSQVNASPTLVGLSDPVKGQLVAEFENNFKSKLRQDVGGFIEIDYVEVVLGADIPQTVTRSESPFIQCHLALAARYKRPIVIGVTGYYIHEWKTSSTTTSETTITTAIKVAISASVDDVLTKNRTRGSEIFNSLTPAQKNQLALFKRTAPSQVDTPVSGNASASVDYQATIRKMTSEIVSISSPGHKFIPSYLQLSTVPERFLDPNIAQEYCK